MRRPSFVPLSLAVLLGLAGCISRPEIAAEDAWLEKVYDSNGGIDTEMQSLQAAKGRAVRKDEDLILTFADGKTQTLHSDIAGCADGGKHCDGFRLAADLPARHFYLVREYFHEGDQYWLIDDRSGRNTRIDNVPQFSPDGSRFLVQDDSVANYHENDLEIWRRRGDGAMREWGTALTEAETGVSRKFGPPHTLLLSWQDDRIVLRFMAIDSGDASHVTVRQWNGALSKGPAGWHLEAHAPAAE